MSTINIKIEEKTGEVEKNQIKIKIEETPPSEEEEYTHSEEYTENPNDVKQEKEEEVLNKQVKKWFCEAAAASAQNQCCMKVWKGVSNYYKYKLKKKTHMVKRFQRAEMAKAKVFIKM